MIVLVGFMGAGKTTVGRALARLLGTPFVDTDAEIERRAGVPIAEIFSTWGEGAFRALERQVVAETLVAHTGVVALGGGALCDPATRSLLASTASADVVHLHVELDEALRRVDDASTRPLLNSSGAAQLFDDRKRLYEEVTGTRVATGRRTPEDVAAEIAQRVAASAAPRRVPVTTDGRRYAVVVGHGVAPSAAEFVPELSEAEQVFVIADATLESQASAVASSFRDIVPTRIVRVPPGEDAKTLECVAGLYGELAQGAAHRHDLVVGVGGGSVTDVAGFVASTFNRGMAVAFVPTTLTAQADASIGGKTGINLPHGKNLVGTFHQPCAVICDVGVLSSLAADEIRAGLAEVIKHGLIADPELAALVRSRANAILDLDRDLLIELVGRSVGIKAGVVSRDERDRGVRAVLNYGHTFAHAIEQLSGFEMRHGEAVAIGMMAAAHLGQVLGRFDESVVKLHRSTLSAVGLPVAASLDVDALERVWRRDKKYRGGARFVVLAEIGRAEPGIQAPREAIVEAVERLKTWGFL